MEINPFKLYTDGAYIKHLGAASSGGYIVDSNNKIIKEFSKIIEKPEFFTFHESIAMYEGLKIAQSYDIKNIICYSDCQTLCEILNKDDKKIYKERNIFIKDIDELISLFDSIHFIYIPRKDNKHAHLLTQEIIKKNFSSKNLLDENGIKIDNLYCSERFLKEEKFKFNQIKNQIVNFLVFSFEQTTNEQFINVLYSKKEKDSYYLEQIEIKKMMKRNWQEQSIFFISDTISNFIQNKSISSLGLIIIGNNSRKIEHLLKGTTPITKKTENSLLYFKKVVSPLKYLTIYKNFNIINLLFPKPSIKIIENQYRGNLKDFYLYSLKELGNTNYKIGQNPLIENHFDVRHKTPIELQKKFFGEFLKLNIIEIQKLKHPFNKELFRNSIKEELLNKGINFKY